MKIYDLVKNILEEKELARSSDKFLIWSVWFRRGFLNSDGYLTPEGFKKSPSLESITRARRKVQELHSELAATEKVRNARINKEESRGTFVFREEIKTQGVLI